MNGTNSGCRRAGERICDGPAGGSAGRASTHSQSVLSAATPEPAFARCTVPLFCRLGALFLSVGLGVGLCDAETDAGVSWKPLLRQSLYFLGIEHGFRLATEPGTRQGLRGPFLRNYLRSVGNLHGWADGDPFYVNYLGHPIQGSVSSFIFVQNDPGYRAAEFGAGRRYWMSRLRATGWSWAYSEQFEIGPLSEASIGSIQSRYPQQGFVDHIVTPVIGLGWTVTEDLLDKYVVKRLEDCVRNRWARLLLRGGLNPSRSAANALRGRAPWHRDSREGVLTYVGEADNLETFPAATSPPDAADFERTERFEIVTGSQAWVFPGAKGSVCLGGGGAAAYRLNPFWQLVLDVSGCRLLGLGQFHSGDALSYAVGPRWTPYSQGRWNPRVEVLLGGLKLTEEQMWPERKALLEAASKQFGGEEPNRAEYTKQAETNTFSLAVGGGVDVSVTPALALRLADVRVQHAWSSTLDGSPYHYGVRFSMGVVLRVGTW